MILAMETSTARGSIALLGDRSGFGDERRATSNPPPVFHAEFSTGRGRGGEFFRALEAALAALADGGRLEAVVVGLGPGSYSGVRLAIAAATGLALARGAALRGRSSFEALGTDAPAFHVVGDARRGVFYYAAVRGGRCAEPPELLDRTAVLARVAAEPGWPLLASEGAEALGELPVAAVCPPEAAALLRGAGDLPEPAGALEPIYLRPPAVTLPKLSAS